MSIFQTSFLLVLLCWAGLTTAIANDSIADYCAVSTEKSGQLSTARALFKTSCPSYTLVDCDPVASGGWQCSSILIGFDVPAGVNASTVATQTASTNAGIGSNSNTVLSTLATTTNSNTKGVQQEETVQSSAKSECYAVATGLNSAEIAFAQMCPDLERGECEPLRNNRWVCSSANISNEQLKPEVDDPVTNPVSIPKTESSVPNNTHSPIQSDNAPLVNTQIGRLAPNDLLVLHYDNCPEKDDGHAIPAGKSVVEKYDINNVLAVNGTCGNSILNSFNSDSNEVMKAAWGTEFLDVSQKRSEAVEIATTRWASTLSNGADVWLAEGGQSDFTADVVRQIESRYTSIDLKRIHIIQHNTGQDSYNEKFTDGANLSYLKNSTSYKAIANGNVGSNGTANLSQQSFYFVSTARASRFSAEWNAGFQYLPPDCSVRTESCKLDFSDTVELLYIVDDTQTQNVNDFANKYLY